MRRKVFVLVLALLLGIGMNLQSTETDLQMFMCYFGLYTEEMTVNMFTMAAFTRFLTRYLPMIIFQAFTGIEFFRFFCSSSVYVFSRIKDRRRWYRAEMIKLLAISFAFAAIYILSSAGTVFLFKSGTAVSLEGIVLMLYAVASWALWSFCMTMLVNFTALKIGSGGGFALITGVQLVLLSVMSVCTAYPENRRILALLGRINPFSIIMPGWQNFRVIDMDLMLPISGTYALDSLLALIVLCIVVFVTGRRLITGHDLLVSDAESGGV